MRLISIGEDQVLFCEACESTFAVSADVDPLGVCPVCGAALAPRSARTVALDAVADVDHEGNAT